MADLLWQLVARYPNLGRHVVEGLKTPNEERLNDPDHMWGIFLTSIEDPEAPNIIILMDGVDKHRESAIITQFFRRIRTLTSSGVYKHPGTESGSKVRMLVTSRPLPTEEIHSEFEQSSIIRLEDEPYLQKIHDDVNLLIKSSLADIPTIRNRDQSSQRLIEATLRAKSNQTFLWVVLVIKRLRESPTGVLDDLLRIIEEIPEELSDLYRHFLSGIKHHQIARDWLVLVATAVRPLMLEEINLAKAIDGGIKKLSHYHNKYEPDVPWALSEILGSLVNIKEDQVFFVHESFTDFFRNRVGQYPELTRYVIQPEQANLKMAKICTSYLLMPEIKHHDIFAELRIKIEDPDSSDFASDLQQFFARNDPHTKTPEELYVANENYKFLDYAAINWTIHVRLAGDSISKDPELLESINLLTGRTQARSNWLKYYCSSQTSSLSDLDGLEPLTIASLFGLEPVVRDILSNYEPSPNIGDPVAETFLQDLLMASQRGYTPIVRMLLEKGVPQDINALVQAAAAGHLGTVEYLARKSSADDLNATSDAGITALSAAIENGHVKVAQYLLHKGGVDIAKVNTDGSTPLIMAVSRGNLDIFEELHPLLKNDKIAINHIDQNGRSALSYAAEYGHSQMVDNLTTRNHEILEVNSQDKGAGQGLPRGRTPMLFAAEAGHCEIIKLLAEADETSVTVRDTFGRQPLSAACKKHHLEAITCLLNLDPMSINTQDKENTPALWHALIHKDKRTFDTVKLLLQNPDIDVDRKQNDGRTSLSKAASNMMVEEAALLLDKGADVDLADDIGKTPLMHAVCGFPQFDMVKLLVQRGADCTVLDHPKDKSAPRRTALEWAQHNNAPEDILAFLRQT